MFNIGSGELVVIAVVALLVLGPKRLPELARGIGKFMREFRKQTDEVRTVVEREFYTMDRDVSVHDAPTPEGPAIRPPEGGAVARGSPLDPELPMKEPEAWRSQLTAALDKAEPPSTVFQRPLASTPPPESAAKEPAPPAAPDVADPAKPK